MKQYIAWCPTTNFMSREFDRLQDAQDYIEKIKADYPSEIYPNVKLGIFKRVDDKQKELFK